jgi:threonylcarbamoyladenosine tRNA methylthiotransferase MtaB
MGAPRTSRERTRIAITTLGCKVNFFDTLLIEEALDPRAFHHVPFEDVADLYVVNTCTVTANADAQARNLIRRAKRRNPDAQIFVTGCYASARPEELRAMPEVARVLTLVDRPHIARALGAVSSRATRPRALPILADAEVPTVGSRKRPIVRIQEGCDADCSFCVIPTSRGRDRRSMAPSEIFERLDAHAAAGAREVVLTGPYIGGYGDDLAPPIRLSAVLEQIARRGLPLRLRVSSIQPTELDDALLDVLAEHARWDGPICRHLHVPLQSGDDDVLARMNRPYRAADYARLVERIAARVPGIGLGADVIAGHPGEDEAAFERTYALLATLPLSYLHVFPYSARPGTPAAAMTDTPLPPVAKARAAKLRALDAVFRARFAASQVGTLLDVLVQGPSREGASHAMGYADHYAVVHLDDGARAVAGTIVRARTVEARGGALIARTVSP